MSNLICRATESRYGAGRSDAEGHIITADKKPQYRFDGNRQSGDMETVDLKKT